MVEFHSEGGDLFFYDQPRKDMKDFKSVSEIRTKKHEAASSQEKQTLQSGENKPTLVRTIRRPPDDDGVFKIFLWHLSDI